MDCDSCGREVPWYEIEDADSYAGVGEGNIEYVLCADCGGGRVQVHVAYGFHPE